MTDVSPSPPQQAPPLPRTFSGTPLLAPSPSPSSPADSPRRGARRAFAWLKRPHVLLPLLALVLSSFTFLPFISSLLPHSHPRAPPQYPFPGGPGGGGGRAVRVGTWNLRFDGQRDRSIPVGQPGDGSELLPSTIQGDGYGERAWDERRWRVSDTILQQKYNIIGFQEAFKSQVDDMQGLLGPRWSWVGVGRNDGFQAGEYAPIFYDTDRFDQVAHDVIWLSPTPNVPGSKGWDASQPRIATFLTLFDRLSSSSSPALLHVANTHWDDQGVFAREMSGRMLRDRLPAWAKAVEKASGWGDGKELVGGVVLIGDLNSPAEEQGYQALTNNSLTPLSPTNEPTTTTPAFHDAINLLALRAPSTGSTLPSLSSRPAQLAPHLPFGPWTTYTGFDAGVHMTRIDFVFLLETSAARSSPSGALPRGQKAVAEAREGKWEVAEHAVIDNWVDGDRTGWKGRSSDHRAVLVELVRV